MSSEVVVLFESTADALQIIQDGQLLPILINNRPFGLARRANALYVFDRACPHAGYDLTTGKLSPAGTIVCPWHNYQFQLQSGQELSEQCTRLKVQQTFLNDKGQVCYSPWS